MSANLYYFTSGATPAPGGDLVFTPDYSYLMQPAPSLNSSLPPAAGNTNGAASATPAPEVTLLVSGTEGALADSSSFTFTSTLAGAGPAVSYQWRKNNSLLVESTGVTGLAGPALTVGYAKTHHSGAYALQATLANGDIIVSNPKHITIGAPVPPQITKQPHAIGAEGQSTWPVDLGDSISLFVEAVGDPVLNYQWQKRQRYNPTAWDNIPGATFPTLNLGHVTIDDGSVYRAVVTNHSGTRNSDDFTLIVYNTGDPYRVGNSRGDSNGGGGAVSPWCAAALALLAAARLRRSAMKSS
jgi:hypothetical protein